MQYADYAKARESKIVLANLEKLYNKLEIGDYIEYIEDIGSKKENEGIIEAKGVIVDKYNHFLLVKDHRGRKYTLNKIDLLDKVTVTKHER